MRYHPDIFRIVIFSFSLFTMSQASVFYCDPQNGSMENDGSEEHPWSTLEEVFDNNLISSFMYENKPAEEGAHLVPKNESAPVTAGDTIMLKNGYHGDIFASEYYNDDFITIMAFPGQTPKVAAIELRSGCRWRISGLTVSPSFAKEYQRRTLINFSSHNWTGVSHTCIAEACTVYSVPDASNWTMKQWDTLSCNGISLPGNRMSAAGNFFKNVNFAIAVTGDSCMIENNTVENFSGDGMRGLGDYCTFQYNTIKNCYDVNANHDDGFQSWSVGDDGVGTGVVYGVTLRGNTIINYEDPNQPFRGTLQGIGCFDGMFEGWLIENNVVITDHWHGITLSGATNCMMINNTVVDLNDEKPGPPWVRFSDHKDGTPSTGCVIRNNLTTSINASSEGVTIDHNIIIDDYDTYFVDYAKGDLRLKAGCPAIDSGSAEGAPASDIMGRKRPIDGAVDVGAYEYTSAKVAAGKYVRTVSSPLQIIRLPHEIQLYFHLVPESEIVISSFDGRKVAVYMPGKSNTVVWNTTGIKSGVYLVSFNDGKRIFSQPVSVVK